MKLAERRQQRLSQPRGRAEIPWRDEVGCGALGVHEPVPSDGAWIDARGRPIALGLVIGRPDAVDLHHLPRELTESHDVR